MSYQEPSYQPPHQSYTQGGNAVFANMLDGNNVRPDDVTQAQGPAVKPSRHRPDLPNLPSSSQHGDGAFTLANNYYRSNLLTSTAVQRGNEIAPRAQRKANRVDSFTTDDDVWTTRFPLSGPQVSIASRGFFGNSGWTGSPKHELNSGTFAASRYTQVDPSIPDANTVDAEFLDRPEAPRCPRRFKLMPSPVNKTLQRIIP